MDQIPIITSRFNNNTWAENIEYRLKCYDSKDGGCIYGAPLKMTDKISGNTLVFVVEMNNETNKIEGVGLIRNVIQFDKYYKVYQTGNYNRYVYKSEYRIGREELKQYNPELISILDYILFKEKTHLKRGSGFTMIPDKLLKHKKCAGLHLNQELKTIFQRHYPNSTDTSDVEKGTKK